MVVFYIGICVMLFGGGAFIAFFSRLLMSLLAEEPIVPEKVMLWCTVWFIILAVGAVLTVIGYFLKKKQAAAAAAAAAEVDDVAYDVPAVEDHTEADAEAEVEAPADEATEDTAEQPTEDI